MHAIRTLARPLGILMTLCMIALSTYGPLAQAAMVGTGEAVDAERAEQARDRIEGYLARDEVRQQLESMGVDPADATARVRALSDAEALAMAERMDQMPAGGADVLGVLLVVFIVLLVTDILGYTDVFPFVVDTAQ